MKFMLK